MEIILHSILESWKELFFWLLGFAIVFGGLAKAQACNPKQPYRRPGIVTDLLYCFIMPKIGRAHV